VIYLFCNCLWSLLFWGHLGSHWRSFFATYYTPQRRVIPRHVPIINSEAEATRMTVQKYNTVAIQYDEWLNMAKTCRSDNDLTNCMMAQLLDSNATQHKVTLLLEYLTAMMSQQKSEYLHEMQKIDQQFKMYAYTEEQDKLLFEYLPNIYMPNDNANSGEVSRKIHAMCSFVEHLTMGRSG
jgi:hypothetical protein